MTSFRVGSSSVGSTDVLGGSDGPVTSACADLPSYAKPRIFRSYSVVQNLVITVLAVVPLLVPVTALPVRAEPAPIVGRTITQNLSTTTLIGQGRIYGGPGQVPNYDWPNPRGAQQNPQYEQRANLQPLIDPPAGDQLTVLPPPGPRQNPQFEQGPNLQPLIDPPQGDQHTALPPPGPTQLRADIARQSLSATTMVGQDSIYGDPGQAPTIVFPNPVRLLERTPQYEQGPNLQPLNLQPSSDPPQGDQHTDLPPRSPKRLRADIAGQSLSTTTMVGQGTIYGDLGQAPTVSFPNPVRRTPWLHQYEQGPNFQILNAPVDLPPPGKRLLDLPPQGPVLPTQYEQTLNLRALADPPKGGSATDLPLVGPRRGRQFEQGPNLQPLLESPRGERAVEVPPPGPRRLRQYEQGPNLTRFEPPPQPLPPGKVSLDLPFGHLLLPPSRPSIYLNPLAGQRAVHCLQVVIQPSLSARLVTESQVDLPDPHQIGSLQVVSATLLSGTVVTDPNCGCS